MGCLETTLARFAFLEFPLQQPPTHYHLLTEGQGMWLCVLSLGLFRLLCSLSILCRDRKGCLFCQSIFLTFSGLPLRHFSGKSKGWSIFC